MNRKVKILPKKEILSALALCREVFLEFEAPDYPPEGTQNFLSFLDPEQINRMLESDYLTFFGAYQEGNLIGTGAVREQNHICLLFVKKGFQRQGVGTALLETMLKFCRKVGTESVTVHASPYGRPFYEANGFQKQGDEQCQDGIRFIPMERKFGHD